MKNRKCDICGSCELGYIYNNKKYCSNCIQELLWQLYVDRVLTRKIDNNFTFYYYYNEDYIGNDENGTSTILDFLKGTIIEEETR